MTEDHTDHRRGHERVIEHWDNLRGDRAFPEEHEIDTQELADLWSSCFLLKPVENKINIFKYAFMGPSLIEAYGNDLNGIQVDQDTKPNINSLTKSATTVVKNKIHIVDESEFTNAKGQEVKYRACLVPFGSAPDKVKYILGFMRWQYHVKA